MSLYAIFSDQSFNDTLTDIFSFEQLGPGIMSYYMFFVSKGNHFYSYFTTMLLVLMPCGGRETPHKANDHCM